PSLVRVQPVDEEEGVRIIGPSPQPAIAPAEDEHHEGAVGDLFARLRAEREAAVTKAEEVLQKSEEASVAEAEVPAETVDDTVEADISDDVSGSDEARALLDRRDQCIEPVASDLVRRLKRVLQDEQNEILDRLRQTRGRTRTEDALPSAAAQAGRYRDAAAAPLA